MHLLQHLLVAGALVGDLLDRHRHAHLLARRRPQALQVRGAGVGRSRKFMQVLPYLEDDAERAAAENLAAFELRVCDET